MRNFDLSILGCFTLIIIIFGIDCLIAWVFMLLWNWLSPLFWASAPILTFWQAFGLMLLVDIIGSFFKVMHN